MPTRAIAIALLTLVACREDPEARAAAVYLEQLGPLLNENGFLAERVLTTAASVYNDGVPKEQVAEHWTRDIVPLAEHLHDQATLLKPPPAWDEQHTALVVVWGDRADAYRQLADALQPPDREQWDDARKRSDEVKLIEEAWFRDINAALVGHGLAADQFP